jgi:hypothetical protein
MPEKILTSSLAIVAEDKTGAVFDRVGAKIDKLASATRRIGGMSSQFQTLGNHVNGVGQKLELLHSKFTRLESAGKRLSSILGPLHGTLAAIAAMEVGKLTGEAARETAKATAEGAHERVRMETAGMTPGEIKEAEAASAELTGKFKPVSQTTILHLLRNARSIVGSYEEAGKIIEPLLKTYVVAMGAHPNQREELEGDFDKLVKGMEIKGVTQNLPAFERYLNGMSKALNVFGDTLRPTDYYEMFKYGRAATAALSEQFMLKTGPTLAQELGGSGTGKALSSFYTQFVGGKMSNKSVEQLLKYDLLDPRKVIKTTTGNVKGVLPGGVLGGGYLTPGHVDPYQWVNKILIPALKKKGVTSPAKIQEVIAAMASQQTSAQAMVIFATQQSRIKKDWALIEHAKGSEAAQDFMGKDPYVAMHGVTEQFTNLIQAAGNPLAQPAADALNATARALNSLYEVAGKYPNWAAGGLLGGGAAVTAGAAAAGWWGVNKGMKFLRGSPSIAPAAAEGMGAFGFLGTLMAGLPILEWVNAGQQLRHDARHQFQSGQPVSLDDWLPAPLKGGAGGEVELKGNADIGVTVKIEPSEQFNAALSTMIDNRIGAVRINGVPATGTTGSTGKSMTEIRDKFSWHP